MNVRSPSFALGLVFAAACAEPKTPMTVADIPTVASAAPSASAALALPVVPGHSIDVAGMDRAVRPGADFFLFANGGWFKATEIEADRGDIGAWLVAQKEVEKRTKALLDDAVANAPKGSQLAKVGDYYASYVDEAAIEKAGLTPLKATLDRISKVGDLKALSKMLGSQLRADVDAENNTEFVTRHLFGLWVEQDLADPAHAVPYLLQGGLGMPERSYYLDTTPAMEALRPKYVKYLAAMFVLAGVKPAEADAKAARVMALETKIAQAHATRSESEDVSKANNPWPREEFQKRAPGLDWAGFFEAAELGKQSKFIVWHANATVGLSALVKSEPIAAWRDWMTIRALARVAWMLPKAFRDTQAAFFLKEVRGIPEPPPRWRLGIEATNDVLGEDVGRAYVAKWFPPESKKDVETMVANIVAAFGKRLDALEWMAPATRAKAKEKLATLKVGIGYPDAWHDDAALTITRGDPIGNFERAQDFAYQQALAKLGKPMDRGEWVMIPQVVNAVNLPLRNALNFPAGMLQPPFFDPSRTPAANYGAIGAIIGHEISHSFDDQGAKFDAHGLFVDWWTPADLAHFQASGAALAAQFSAYKPFPDLAVNGTQTLSENIADLAGLAAAWDAWRASLGGNPAPMQDGLTGEEQFFLADAQAWRSKERDGVLREWLVGDGHAPPRYRSLTVRNLDGWYDTFHPTAEDALFLTPEKRVRVW